MAKYMWKTADIIEYIDKTFMMVACILPGELHAKAMKLLLQADADASASAVGLQPFVPDASKKKKKMILKEIQRRVDGAGGYRGLCSL